MHWTTYQARVCKALDYTYYTQNNNFVTYHYVLWSWKRFLDCYVANMFSKLLHALDYIHSMRVCKVVSCAGLYACEQCVFVQGYLFPQCYMQWTTWHTRVCNVVTEIVTRILDCMYNMYIHIVCLCKATFSVVFTQSELYACVHTYHT